MAEIVGAFGVPHTPVFPFFVKRDGPDCEIARFFAALTAELETLKPDLIVMFDTDHLNTFFLDNLPIFAVGVAETFKGPNDEPREVPVHDIKSLPDFAAHIRSTGVDAGFDLALVQEFTVDHSVVVPLHFMTPQMQIPVVPIFINGHVPPLPKAQRCFELGRAVETRHRDLAEAAARRHHGQRQLLARRLRTAHRARPHRRRARSGLGERVCELLEQMRGRRP